MRIFSTLFVLLVVLATLVVLFVFSARTTSPLWNLTLPS